MKIAVFSTVLLSFLSLSSENKKIVLKAGVLAPEGSSWMETAKKFKKSVETGTEGRVKITWYAGGVMGDEGDMIKKMRIGQLQMGGFTDTGLGFIDKSFRIFNLPFLFNSHEEYVYVRNRIFDDLKNIMRKKGFELLYHLDIGFIYIFSQSPISGLSNLKGVNLWVWAGDQFVEEMVQTVKDLSAPMRLPITDVLTALRTRMINAFYSTPYATLALQWHNHIKYITDLPLALSAAGLIIRKSEFDSLSERDRKAILESASIFDELTEKSQKENDSAFEIMKKTGIIMVKPDLNSPDFQNLRKKFLELHEKLKGEFYSEELYKKVKTAIEEFRAKKEKE